MTLNKHFELFDLQNIKEAPHIGSCVYVMLNRNNEPLYVGITFGPRKRIYSHLKGYSKNTKEYHKEFFKALVIFTEDNLSLEKFLTRHLTLKYNTNKHTDKQFKHVDSNEEYKDVVEMIKEYVKEE